MGMDDCTRIGVYGREYAARMNRVVDHIHLNEPLELERVAAIACCSPFTSIAFFRPGWGRRFRYSSIGCVWNALRRC